MGGQKLHLSSQDTLCVGASSVSPAPTRPHSHSCVEVLTPILQDVTMTVFADRIFKEVIKVK